MVTTVDITSSVLIDTWWNVNKLRDTPVLADRIVLIDTWWNVNAVKSILNLHSVNRFNRYMVECESNKSSWKSVVWWSFNRYMVECELLQ